jgi:hypothetical protein
MAARHFFSMGWSLTLTGFRLHLFLLAAMLLQNLLLQYLLAESG